MMLPRGVLPPQEGGRRACDADEELEEGEARPDDGDEDYFNPDVALSYIDEKIQHVLGHFQKDFEGGVSADSLGPKFGGYGSFLPTYQHSPPLLPQTRSSHAADNIITSTSPCQPSAERIDRDLSTVAVQSISRNNDSIPPSTSDLCKNEGFSTTNSEELVAGSDSLDSSNNVLSRKNAVIYSGLGPDISSSSSMEESPDRFGGTYESPQTILQVMTCFHVPGGFMLSPLHDNILQKERIMNTTNENDFDVTSARKNIPTSVKHEPCPVSDKDLHMLSSHGAETTNAAPVSATVMIRDHWVCCEFCQKWRLLPCGTNPSMLPKKWKCSMLYWLPGMNRCDISEDKTTNALNALYVIPAPAIGVSSGGPHTAGGDIAILSVQNIRAQLENCGKRKTSPSHGNGSNESSYHTPLETPLISNQENPKKQNRTVDDENNNFEKDSVSTHDLRPMSKSADLVSEKQKSEGGELKERTRVPSKLKTKRGIGQDKHKTFKKTKNEDQPQINRDWEHERDSAGGEVSGEPKDFAAKAKAMKGSLETGDIPLSKEKFASAYEKYAKKVGIVNTDSDTIHSSVKPIFHGSLQANSDSCKKEVAQSGQAQLSAIPCLKKVCDNNLPKASGRRGFPETSTGVGTGAVHLSSSDKRGLETEGPSQKTGSDAITHENKTSAHRRGCGSSPKLGISIGGEEKSKPRNPKQDIQKPAAQCIHLTINEGKQEVCSTSVKFDVSQMEALSRRHNVENGVQHVTLREAGLKRSDASSIGKDGSMVSFALKEARDLKHKANHLKNKGLELESTRLYFEAALKFLHVAFLLETPTYDNSRPGDAAESMKMYSETAKLCKFCAHEYERSKKMAAAALAYKCVEVAYLKAAYYKNPSASKDRQQLQAVVQITPATKDGNSPRVDGDHLPLAVRNQAHLLRLLAYTYDVNCAFDATRKSQVAIISAIGSQGQEGTDDGLLASVKTVLDFNFNNVNELLRLIRLSMDSISI